MVTPRVLPAPAPSHLDTLVEDYLTHCRARGLSPRTLKTSYSYSLRRVLLPWCEREGITSLDELDARAFDRFTVALLEGGGRSGKQLSKHSVASYIRAVRQFLSWALKEGENVVARPQLPKLPKKHREVLSREEIDRLEDGAPTERDKVIIRIFGDCGLRLAEVSRLRTKDILRGGNRAQLLVRGKGERERKVPVPPRLVRRIDRLIMSRPRGVPTDRLFVSLRRGLSGEYEPLTESGVAQIVQSASERVQLGRNVHPHLLRHSWMTPMLRSGMNPI